MATLKDISTRLKAVKNIQKITKSMKIVSAAKFSQAEKALRPARSYGEGAKAFYEKAEVQSDEKKPNHLIIALTSDRGLCGAIHSSIVRAIRAAIIEKGENVNVKLIPIGDKSKAMFQRQHGDKILMHFTEIGKKPPSFGDASAIAQAILNCDYEYEHAELYFNVFRTVVSYRTTILPIFNLQQVSNAGKINLYDSIDEDVLRCYNEFSLASLIFFAMKEAACSEQSARMTAMDSASKNAGEMIDKLTLLYNRTRQAVITRELIEIISGAAALD
jgi:F-type H+-transporting ATPase subunit gamma